MSSCQLRLLVVLLCVGTAFISLRADDKPLTSEDRKKLEADAEKVFDAAFQHYQQGRYAEALKQVEQALAIQRRLYPTATHPDGHAEVVSVLSAAGTIAQQSGQLDKALQYYNESLKMCRKLYAPAQFPDGHSRLARCLSNLGTLHEAMGEYRQSLSFAQEAVQMNRKLKARSAVETIDLARSVANYGSVLESLGEMERSLAAMNEAMTLYRDLYRSNNSPQVAGELAKCANNLGYLHKALGAYEKAQGLFEETLAQFRDAYPAMKFPNGHPNIAQTIDNLANLFESMGAWDKALAYSDQSVKMLRSLFAKDQYPSGHIILAGALKNRARMLGDLGEPLKSIALYQEALAMYQLLFSGNRFPRGHPLTAACLRDLAFEYGRAGDFQNALAHHEQAASMYVKLYPREKFPDGHIDLLRAYGNLSLTLEKTGPSEKVLEYATKAVDTGKKLFPKERFPKGHDALAGAHANLAKFLWQQGDHAQSIRHAEAAVEVFRALYPDGHGHLVASLNNLANPLEDLGQHERARRLFEEALAMARKVFPPNRFPDGHPAVFATLGNLGGACAAAGDFRTAFQCYAEEAALVQKHARRAIALAPEADALAFLATLPNSLGSYLTVGALVPNTDAELYRSVWQNKAAVTRLLERRHAAARVAGKSEQGSLEELSAVRRRIEQLLHATRLKQSERDQLLKELSDKRDRLERELASALPQLERWKQSEAWGPDDLSKALPVGSAFVDIVRYPKRDWSKVRKARFQIHYAAFVVVPGKDPKRVELGEEVTLGGNIVAWRNSIEAMQYSAAGQTLRSMVWAPIAKVLPPDTHTIYIAPDGNLARLPWSALPGDKPDTILLEQYSLAVVPYGAALLEQIKAVRDPKADVRVLAVGDIDYGASRWPALPGTRRELAALEAIQPQLTKIASGHATPASLTAAMSKANVVHLATHGFFAAAEVAAEKKRELEAITNWQFHADGERRHLTAGRNPLAFTGLVLAGGEVMTGMSLVDQPLEHLRLVTLSACETGLGELTGGEGVYGLVRAFHLAGCPNVVASLWKVSDAATAALMAKFYHELWVNKKPPIEALREAQLFIYHHPELIPDALGERGAPKRTEALAVNNPAKPQVATKRADTKLWAAFVLSGVGK